MLSLFNKKDINKFYANLLLTVFFLSFSSFAQIPLSLSDINTALEKKQPEAELIKKIKKQKVNFFLTSSDSVKLSLNGASEQLLHTIITNRKIVKLPIAFNGWKPFGEISIAPWEKNRIVMCRGNSSKYPGLSTNKTFYLGNRRILVVKMAKIDASIFSDQDKMLKVFASQSNKAIKCITDSLRSSDDPDFVLKKAGEFRYRIPESMLVGGALKKLGLQFGPGRYKTFKISAWFE